MANSLKTESGANEALMLPRMPDLKVFLIYESRKQHEPQNKSTIK